MSSKQGSYVLVLTGAAGYIGQQLAQRLVSEPFVNPDTSTVVPLDLTLVDIVKAPIPQLGQGVSATIEALDVDLTKKENVDKLVARKRVDAVFVLHGIMSGQSEQNYDLGLSVGFILSEVCARY
jgi:nucleoside-diphosphate-sugar epimerase